MSEEPETTTPEPEAPAETVLEKVEAAVEAMPSELSQHAQLVLQEIEVFWANVFANVSARVETPVHNFIQSEVESLKARVRTLF